MSGIASGAVWKSGLYVGADLTVLLKLADYADDHGTSHPAASTIARMCGLKRRSVFRILRRLQEDRIITIRSRTGRGNTNNITINLERLEAAGLFWYRHNRQGARFRSLAECDAAIRAFQKGDSDDAPAEKKGDSDDVGAAQKGDSDDNALTQKGDSQAAKGDSNGPKGCPGSHPESEESIESGAPAGARADRAPAAASISVEHWRELRRKLRSRYGEAIFFERWAGLRLEGGRIIASTRAEARALLEDFAAFLTANGVRAIDSQDGTRVEI